MTNEPDEDDIIWMPVPAGDEPGITLDFSSGAYVELEDLSIWITDQQTATDTGNPLYAHWVTGQLLKAASHNLITVIDDVVLVDDRLKAFLSQRLRVQLPEATAPVSRENPNKEFVSEAVDAYQSEKGQLPGSLNVLLAFAVEHGVPGYVDIADTGGTKRERRVSFTDSQRRTVKFSTLEDVLKTRLGAIKHD